MDPNPGPTDPVIRRIRWPHAPPHRLADHGSYFVSTRTYRRLRLFRDPLRLNLLHDSLLQQAEEDGWQLEAWAVFVNHYHFVGHPVRAIPPPAGLGAMIGRLHKRTASALNAMDDRVGRKVWHNYKETHLTFERSHLARLNYTHQNAVKHGLVAEARDYPWCSAAWLERTASAAWVRTVYSFKTDMLDIDDEFD